MKEQIEKKKRQMNMFCLFSPFVPSSKTIELALRERQGHFNELIHCHEYHHGRLKTKIDHLIQRWNELSSLSKSKYNDDRSIDQSPETMMTMVIFALFLLLDFVH